MSDFVVNAGAFSSQNGLFSAAANGGADPSDDAARGGRFGRRHGKHHQNNFSLTDLGDALKLSLSPAAQSAAQQLSPAFSNGQPQLPGSSAGPVAAPELGALATASDQIVSNYVKYLKGVQLTGDTKADATSALKQADGLVHAVTDPLGIADSDIQTLDIRSDYSLSQVYGAYAQQDANSAQAGVYAGVSAQAHLTADITTKSGEQYHVEISLEADAAAAAQVSQGQDSQPVNVDQSGGGTFSLNDLTGGTSGDQASGAVGQGFDLTAFLNNLSGVFKPGDSSQPPPANGAKDGNGADTKNTDVTPSVVSAQNPQQSLAQLSLSSLTLSNEAISKASKGGDNFSGEGSIFRSSKSYSIADILFGYRTLSTEA